MPILLQENGAFYYLLEEATCTTSIASSIKPFQRAKNKCHAWLALTGQYNGKNKWEAELKCHEQLLHTHEWNGDSNYTLVRFVAEHRNASD